MKTDSLSATEDQTATIGRIVNGTIVECAPFGFWADVGLPINAYVDLRLIPPGKNGKLVIPQIGERICGVIIAYIKNEPRVSLLPESFQ